MKEQIYTIPVMDAFTNDCECPLCNLEFKLEDEYVDYVLGASLMEPDSRIETNEKGFCRKHLEFIYNKQENRLGLGLLLDTHLQEQNKRFKKLMPEKFLDSVSDSANTSSLKGFFKKNSDSNSDTLSSIDNIIKFIDDYEDKCYICDKLNYTMNRYVEVIYHLYFNEPEFKRLFNSKKGFCFTHLKFLLVYAKKHLDKSKASEVVRAILSMQVVNMERLQGEVNWFTKKFDYRFDKEPWENSKDSIPRIIRKLDGPCRFKL